MPAFLRQPVQPKLLVAPSSDPLEREADNVAASALQHGTAVAANKAPNNSIQAKPTGGETQDSLTSPKPLNDSAGLPLSSRVRGRVEPILGADLGDVRVHSDLSAHQSAHALGAKAFTHQKHIWMGANQSPEDVGLMAHESAHVVQQSQRPGTLIQRLEVGAQPPQPAQPVSATTPQVSSATPPLGQTATQAGGALTRPPVLWGLDVSVKPPTSYVSVAVPGYSLAEIATYLYGSADQAASLSAANGGLPEHVPPGKILRPTGAPLAAPALNDFNSAVQQGSVLRSKGTPAETAGHEQMIYRFGGGGQTFELTEGQYLGMLRGAATWIRRKAGNLQDTASVYLETRQDHVKNSNSVIRGISDWAGNADLPDESMYQVPIDQAQQIIDAMTQYEQVLDSLTQGEITPGLTAQLGDALYRLPPLAEKVDRGKRAWHMYIDATIEGAGSTVHVLEITRDVSFGVAAGLAGAVAAPAIFAAAGGGLLGGTLAVGGGALAGSATSGTLHFVGAVGGESLSMAITPGKQSIDWGYVGSQTKTGLKSGAVQGGLGAAGALVAPGVSNVISNRLFGVGTQALTSTGARVTVNVLTGAAMGAPLGGAGSAIENFSAWRSGKITFGQYLGSIGFGTATGGALGGAFALIPVSGLYKTGGQPFNPFSGTATTPRWMFSGPFSPLQADWNPPAGFNSLGADQLPPLRPDYRWVRLNNVWEPMAMNGPFGDPLTLRWYGPESGPGNYNLLSGNQLLGSSAMTRPPGAGGFQGARAFPMQTQDYIVQGGTRQYVRGHNVDFHDTIDIPGTLDSNADPQNYTPEPDWWGLRPRNNLVQQIRRVGGGYRQLNYYSANPRLTANGTPIPDGVYFVATDANGTAVRAWNVPFAPAQGPQTLAGIAQFQIPLNQLPPILLGPPPTMSVAPVGGAGAEALKR